MGDPVASVRHFHPWNVPRVVPEREQSDGSREAGQSAPGAGRDQGAPGVKLSERSLDVELAILRICTRSRGPAGEASDFRNFLLLHARIDLYNAVLPVFLTSSSVFGRYVPLEHQGIDAVRICCLQSGG